MSDPRKLPLLSRLWPKVVMVALPSMLLWWGMNAHYHYSQQHHYKDEENPLSYAADALQQAYCDGVSAFNKTMKVSDQIVAGVKGDPPPGTVAPTRTLPPRDIPPQYRQAPQNLRPQIATEVMVCVPNSLVSKWDNADADPKMAAYKELMAEFIEANGQPGKEYFVGNYNSYQPGMTDPISLVTQDDARRGCPDGFTGYKLPLNPR